MKRLNNINIISSMSHEFEESMTEKQISITSKGFRNSRSRWNNNKTKIIMAVDKKRDSDIEAVLKQVQKEKELANKSRIEVDKQWKEILSKEKLESLKEDVVQLRTKCKSEVQQRKDLIQYLLSKFDHVEDRYRISVASHLATTDEMIQMNDAILCVLEREFNDKLVTLRNEYKEEKKKITTKFEEDKQRLMDEMKSIESEEKRLVDEHNREQQQAIEEIKNKNLEDVNSLRFVLDTRIEDLDEQFEIAKNEYLQKTDAQSEALQKKLTKDKEMSKEIINLQSQIDKLCASTKRLKSVSRRNLSQNRERNHQLMERKNEVIIKYRNTKAELEELRSSRHKKLKDLTMRANAHKSHLKEENEMIERILKLINLAKKMESEEEREEIKSHVIGETLDNEGIWRRYNHSLMSLHVMKEEEKKLLNRNGQLKRKLQEYKDGVTVNDRVINNNNPLMVVNGKMRPNSRDVLSRCCQSSSSVETYCY